MYNNVLQRALRIRGLLKVHCKIDGLKTSDFNGHKAQRQKAKFFCCEQLPRLVHAQPITHGGVIDVTVARACQGHYVLDLGKDFYHKKSHCVKIVGLHVDTRAVGIGIGKV